MSIEHWWNCIGREKSCRRRVFNPSCPFI